MLVVGDDLGRLAALEVATGVMVSDLRLQVS
jgi:hypothetical protein